MQALLISDLHLTPSRPAIARAFISFLEKVAIQADELYILGDFFEYWVGDDAMEPFHTEIAQHLRRYSDQGHVVYIMPGNRDFAIGDDFLRQAGSQWLNDPSIVTLNGEKILLMHGDSLCTDDPQYLRYRRIIRNPLVMKLLRLTPLSYRKKLGRSIRENSIKAKSHKSITIMDVTEQEVIKTMTRHQVRTLIHGHTHRPCVHSVKLASTGTAKRIVLGDWETKGWYIRTDNNALTLEHFDIPDSF